MSNDEGQSNQQSSSATIGPNGRRLSKNGERTATPPRKILPKTSEHLERTPTCSPHLPVGVMGAALSSSRLTSSPMGSAVALKAAALVSGQMQAVMSGQLMQQNSGMMGPNGNQHGVPLTQPLVINTSFAGGPITNAQTVTMAPVQITAAQAGIIMSNTGMRMPMTAVPVQVRTTGGMPIIMPQIALPSGSIIQSVPANVNVRPQQQQQSHMARPNYGYAQQQIITNQQPMTLTQIPVSMMQQITSNSTPPVYSTSTVRVPMSMAMAMSQTSNSMSRSNNSTDVTTSNTQPLVSPGPPMLSPQIGQQMQSQHYQQQQQQQQQNQVQHQQQQNHLQQQQQQNHLQQQQQNQLQHQQNQLIQQQQNQIQQQQQNQYQQQQNQMAQQTQQNQIAQQTKQNQQYQQNMQQQRLPIPQQQQQQQQQQPRARVQTTTSTPIVMPSGLTVTSGAVIRSVPPKMMGAGRISNANQPVRGKGSIQVRPTLATLPSQPLPQQLLPQQPINVPMQQQQQQQANKPMLQTANNFSSNIVKQPVKSDSVQPQQQPQPQQQRGYATVRSVPNRPPVTAPQQSKPTPTSQPIPPLPTVPQAPNGNIATQPPMPVTTTTQPITVTTSAPNVPTNTSPPPITSTVVAPLVSSIPVTAIATLPQHPLPPQAIEQINSRPNPLPASQPEKVSVPSQPVATKVEPKSKPIFSKNAVSSPTVKSSPSSPKTSAPKPTTSSSQKTLMTTSSPSQSKARYSLESHTKSFRVENEAR